MKTFGLFQLVCCHPFNWGNACLYWRNEWSVHGDVRRKGNLSCYRLFHLLANQAMVIILSLQKHQLGNGCFNGAVIAADDPRMLQLIAIAITRHLHVSAYTLTDVDDDDAPFCRLTKQPREPCFLRCVSASVTAHHDTPQVGHLENLLHNIFLQTGKE